MTELKSYPLPFNEPERLASLRALNLPGKAPDPALDQITEVLRLVYGCRTAFVSFVEEGHQWFAARVGMDVTEMPKSQSLCAHVVADARPLVIPDLHDHPRFAGHPLIEDGFPLRFYAGVPLVLENGFVIGALCVIDPDPRPAPTDGQLLQHRHLAQAASIIIERTARQGGADEAALDRAQSDAQEAFLTLVSHELRTPMNGVVGLLDVLSDTVHFDSPDMVELFAALDDSARHLAAVIEHILTFSDLQNGTVRIHRRTQRLSDVILAAARPISVIARRSDRHLHVDRIPEERRVTLDGALVETALSCLLLNAIIHGAGDVTVSHAVDAEGTLHLDIRDAGAGIPPDRLDAALMPFSVADNPLTRNADGVGLGLPLARKFCEMHGGALHFLKSDAGFHARMTLPKTALDPAHFHGTPTGSGGTKRV